MLSCLIFGLMSLQLNSLIHSGHAYPVSLFVAVDKVQCCDCAAVSSYFRLFRTAVSKVDV